MPSGICSFNVREPNGSSLKGSIMTMIYQPGSTALLQLGGGHGVGNLGLKFTSNTVGLGLLPLTFAELCDLQMYVWHKAFKMP